MSEAPGITIGSQNPLHAIWWSVVKPVELVGDGIPAQPIVGTYETLAQATAAVRLVPNGAIVQNLVVFVNPQKAAQASGLVIRN